jgi:hypothetical protein
MMHKNNLTKYQQAKISLMAAKDRFDKATAELATVGDRKVFQGLGKAFLCRPKEELIEDYTSLKDSNITEVLEVNVRSLKLKVNRN